jgi:hypothetical protein
MIIQGYAIIKKEPFKLYSFSESEMELEIELEHCPEELQEETEIVKVFIGY